MNENKIVETGKLERVVSAFGEVMFNFGRFASEKDGTEAPLREAIEHYKKVRNAYKGDTRVYDEEIDTTIESYPDLDSKSINLKIKF